MRDRIDADERVLLFPTAASRAPDRAHAWRLRVHGWIHEPEDGSPLREAVYRACLRALGGLGVDPGEVDLAIPRRRLWPFLVDDERGERVPLGVSGVALPGPTPRSGPDGHFELVVEMDEEALLGGREEPRAALAAGAPASVEVVAGPSVDGRSFAGSVHLVPPEGVSVISDIDDTIKVTEVRDRRAMLANSFARPFRAIPGMAERYRAWAESGAAFHYVSSSPFPLFAELEAFRAAGGFPAGSMSLKRVRLTDPSLLELFRPGEETKPAQIEPILDAFPGRRFVLVGDSGEHDPEVYGRLARERSEQILHVAIRDVGGEHAGSERMRRALAGVERRRWSLFRDPARLRVPGLDAVLAPVATEPRG